MNFPHPSSSVETVSRRIGAGSRCLLKLTGHVCLTAALLITGCARAPMERAWISMATFASVSASGDDASRIDKAASIVTAEFRRLERLWSNYDARSEVSILNGKSGSEVPVSPETRDLLLKSRSFGEATGGTFDPTVGPLVDLWGIGKKETFAIPSDEQIGEALKRCGWANIRVSGEDDTASLTAEGMAFDSGGIAKGLAVDIAYDKLMKEGYQNVMINLGGNMRCSGSGRKGKAWNIGVRNPFDGGKIVGILAVTDGRAVATSGNYERFVEKDGKRYAHVIDPTTGRPVQGMAGVTVISPTAVEADALSTALFVAGVKKGAELLALFPKSKAIFIEDSEPLVLKMSAGMDDCFTLTDDVAVEVLGP